MMSYISSYFSRFAALVIFIFLFSGHSQCQVKWSFEFSGGTALNLPSDIKIYQTGYETIHIKKAKFYSEPFTLPPYWDWRISHTRGKNSFELEAIHHKLYLRNMPSEIKRFSISHGFNMFFINYAKADEWTAQINDKVYKGDIIFRFGIGAVFAHPETEIRGFAFEDKGEFLNTDYYLSGPAINLGIGKRWYILKRLFLNTEIKATSAYVRIPVALGSAKVFTTSFQFIAGLGFDFISKK